MAAQHTMHMQKALSQMNVQIHHVLSDITGVSGMAIWDAVLAGERDPVQLAALCNWRVRSPREVAQTLVGDYRPKHLFTLRQSLQCFRYYQKMIAEVDSEHKKLMDELPRAERAADQMPPRPKACLYQRAHNEPAFDLASELYRIAGVDSPTYPALAPTPRRPSCRRLGPMSPGSETPLRSLLG